MSGQGSTHLVYMAHGGTLTHFFFGNLGGNASPCVMLFFLVFLFSNPHEQFCSLKIFQFFKIFFKASVWGNCIIKTFYTRAVLPIGQGGLLPNPKFSKKTNSRICLSQPNKMLKSYPYLSSQNK